ncbi:MAG TPA: hypothetical protein VGK29_08960 [Paludibaculum sp.]|jgi:hypothetical protein
MAILRSLGIAALAALSLCAQYKAEPAGAAPPEAAGVAGALVKDGVKILKPDGGVVCEIWLVAAAPAGGTVEQNASLAAPHGALLGVARYPARFADRRGQTIKPGVYTMRYSYFPMNGDHQGVAPQRDFAILSPAATDTDAAAKPAFDALMDMSRKASGTPHPLVLSIWKDDPPSPAGVEAVGDHDQVLHTKIGGVAVSIIVVGKAEG